VICLYVNSVVRGTNVTFEFEFGDETHKTLTDSASQQTGTVSLTHIYHRGEHFDYCVIYLRLFCLL